MGFRLVFLSPHFSVSLFPEGTLRPLVILLPHSQAFGFVLAAQSLRRSGSDFRLRPVSGFSLRSWVSALKSGQLRGDPVRPP